MRILAAIPLEAQAILGRALGNAAILLPVLTIEEALDVAAQGVDIIVCGINFDDSQMFELLRAVKADPRLSKTPFVCVRLVGSNLTPTLIRASKSPVRCWEQPRLLISTSWNEHLPRTKQSTNSGRRYLHSLTGRRI
jgi:hypothetical protein